jgi:hypothetical protein
VALSLAADFRRARSRLLRTVIALESRTPCQERFPFSPATSVSDAGGIIRQVNQNPAKIPQPLRHLSTAARKSMLALSLRGA